MTEILHVTAVNAYPNVLMDKCEHFLLKLRCNKL